MKANLGPTSEESIIYLNLSHPRGEEGSCDVSLHFPLALLALSLLAASSVHGAGEAHVPPGCPVNQGVVDKGLQEGQQGLPPTAHHLDYLEITDLTSALGG